MTEMEDLQAKLKQASENFDDDFVFLFDDFMYQIKQKDLSCYSVILKCGFKVKETWG